MTKLQDDAKREVAGSSGRRRACALWLCDVWWRVRDGWAIYLAAPVVAAVAFLLYTKGFFGADMHGAGEWAKSAGAVLAFVIALLGTIRGLQRWLVGGSESAAASLLRRTRDPMRLVKHRFHKLVHMTRQPVAIFVDDLDRCKADYVVELLEGIQTLFATEPVVYVLAADGNWLRDCYTQVYRDFCSSAAEPGRPLGWLFLEKTFQNTVRLPRISAETRKAFWQGLLSEGERERDVHGQDQREAAEKMFEGMGTPVEVGRKMKQARKEGAVDLKELQRAAALQLETDAVEEHTKHTLDKFADFLEDNPRAMKKLINSYGIERDLLVLEDPDLLANDKQLRQLALWTIVNLRWPLLAEYVEAHPETVDALRTGVSESLIEPGDGLDRLMRDRAVLSVIKGTGMKPPVHLDTAVVKRLAGLDDSP